MTTAYDWDQNCQRIHDRLDKNCRHIRDEISALQNPSQMSPHSLLVYFKKWHYDYDLYKTTLTEASSRKNTISELLLKGYGVSVELAKDMDTYLDMVLVELDMLLGQKFTEGADRAASIIYLPHSQRENRNSQFIISSLCDLLSLPRNDNLPLPAEEFIDINPAVNSFFDKSVREPSAASNAILLKMYLSMTEESETIMAGSIGEINVDPPQHIKFTASENLRMLFDFMLSSLAVHTEINLRLIQNFHYRLTKGLDKSHSWNAGEM